MTSLAPAAEPRDNWPAWRGPTANGVASASARPPLRWDEIDTAEPGDFTIATMPARFAELGDLMADIDDHVFDITPLLEWADRDEAAGDEEPPDDPTVSERGPRSGG